MICAYNMKSDNHTHHLQQIYLNQVLEMRIIIQIHQQATHETLISTLFGIYL